MPGISSRKAGYPPRPIVTGVPWKRGHANASFRRHESARLPNRPRGAREGHCAPHGFSGDRNRYDLHTNPHQADCGFRLRCIRCCCWWCRPCRLRCAAPPKGWFKVCTKQEDNDVCIVQNLLTANSGQLITAIGLITVAGKTNRKIMQVSVPSARPHPAGRPDTDRRWQGPEARLRHLHAGQVRFRFEVPLTDQMIASSRRAANSC